MLRKQSKFDLKRTRVKKQQKLGTGGQSRRGRKVLEGLEDGASQNMQSSLQMEVTFLTKFYSVIPNIL
jgi:hypothetical protein